MTAIRKAWHIYCMDYKKNNQMREWKGMAYAVPFFLERKTG